MLSTLTYSVIREQNFLKSGFRKKVEKVESFESRGFHNINIDCVYFNDGTSNYFSTYSVIDNNDTLIDVRVVDFIDIGDSVVKRENEALIRIIRNKRCNFSLYKPKRSK